MSAQGRVAAEGKQAKVRLRHMDGWRQHVARPADSYGLVLALVVLAYIVISVNSSNVWWSVCIVALQGLTLVFALRTSHARQVWVVLAVMFLIISMLLSIADALLPGTQSTSEIIEIVGGILLLAMPVVIGRRISTHNVVTTQTFLGAICVYVLIGFSFASIYLAISFFSHTPFFLGVSHASRNDYLFFSFTTLTTVGYGNLIPAESMGQTFAMLEALLGQIYLVIIVARLVALWGQTMPHAAARQHGDIPPDPSHTSQHSGHGSDEVNT